jgi:hypothetical protein
MTKLNLAVALLLMSVISSEVSHAQSNKDPFPRLAGVNIGSPHSYDLPDYQRDLAKLDIVILNYWPGWEAWRRTSMESVVQSIKRHNPKTKVFIYVITDEVAVDANGWADIKSWLDRNNGGLYVSGTSGAVIPGHTPNFRSINNTVHGARDSMGRNFMEWHADWVVENYSKRMPSIAGIFVDNVFPNTKVSADWNRDGKTDKHGTNSESSRWLREGFAAHFRRTEKAMPGQLLTGNIAEWGAAAVSAPEYQNLLHGGLQECALGATWSPDTWGGFAETLGWYRKTIRMLKDPKLLVFHQCGDKNNYQAFRYGFGVSLLDDGYFAFSDLKAGYTGVHWFDEFDVRLGAATSPPPTQAWQKGVWRRDFEGGIVLVNPKGNGAVELDLGTEFRRVAGKQASAINSGGVAGKVRLADRDGIVLVRVAAARRPRPPANLSVQ